MLDFSALLQQGASNAWLFIPSAILLGALHGLEPGHSKTMMAAFIIAVRGTISQAILLGLCATLSHTAVVWVIALGGMYFGQKWGAESSEPYLQIASALMIIGVALWMVRQTWKQGKVAEQDHEHSHDEVKHIDTGHGVVKLEVFEDGVPPHFRLYQESKNAHIWEANQVKVLTQRPDGTSQTFNFVQRDGFVESEQEIPEPHEFVARLSLGHEHHSHDYDVDFTEHHHHHSTSNDGLDVSTPGYQDPHELAHANDIKKRFANREVTTSQIVMFGLTGGLIPCPASITILLLCLQLKKIALGATLVLSFSIGLALTMVFSGVIAALSIKHITKKWSGFGELARKAPYFSSGLILIVGIYVGYEGIHALNITN